MVSLSSVESLGWQTYLKDSVLLSVKTTRMLTANLIVWLKILLELLVIIGMFVAAFSIPAWLSAVSLLAGAILIVISTLYKSP